MSYPSIIICWVYTTTYTEGFILATQNDEWNCTFYKSRASHTLSLSLCSVCRNIYVYGFSVFRHNNSSNPLLIYLEWEHFLSSLFVPSFPSFASSVFRFFPLCSVFGSLASIFKIHTLIRQNCMKVYKSWFVLLALKLKRIVYASPSPISEN